MLIRDCGELSPGEDWKVCDNDKTEDKLPPFPEDWDDKHKDFTVFKWQQNYKRHSLYLYSIYFRFQKPLKSWNRLKLPEMYTSAAKNMLRHGANIRKPFGISIT